MKNGKLTKYLPLFMSIFMLVSFLGLSTLGGLFLLIISSGVDDFYTYDKWNNSGITISIGLELLGCVALLIGWGAWVGLAVLIERKPKIQIFRPGLHYKSLVGTGPDFLTITLRKSASSVDGIKRKENG
jgi:hypothetical protein